MKAQKTVKPKKYTYFIGIDVSKNKLDYAVMQGKDLLFHRVAKNEPEAILGFLEELECLEGFKIAKAVFCMEDTGFYCNHLVNSLRSLNANINVGNAVHIKNSLGLIRGKDDKIDSIRIAKYSWKNRDELPLLGERRLIMQQLICLNTLWIRLTSVGVMMKNPLKEQANFVNKELQTLSTERCKRTVKAIVADLAELRTAIDRVINSDDRLKRLNQIITSVPGVGPVSAVQLLICTNEFKNIKSPKKFACYSGVAPFKKESGTGTGVIRARVSKAANKKMKSLLHICAMQAIRYDEKIRLYYERKTVMEKKSKMSTINAVRNKLILRIFACVNQDRCYSKDYVSGYLIDVPETSTETAVAEN
ncbi:transposase [Mucilaginibacter flavidus]|uniref:transposase n=1 Tax=Mucilaginibacter flavidus TaxID=2949309 RepID=UPI0020923B03|nr:transposase [Mucilaginibacter flavidus]MCO5947695.1 transposase [Mucilaginibacter flavidus]